MRISDWSSDVCSSDLSAVRCSKSRIAMPATKIVASSTLMTLNAPRMENTTAGALRMMLPTPPPMLTSSEDMVDRTSVAEGTSVSVRVDLGGRRILTKQNDQTHI